MGKNKIDKEDSISVIMNPMYKVPIVYAEDVKDLEIDYIKLKDMILRTGASLGECAAVLGCKVEALRVKIKLDVGVDWHTFYNRFYPIFLLNLKTLTLSRAEQGSDKALGILWDKMVKPEFLPSTEDDIKSSYELMKEDYKHSSDETRRNYRGNLGRSETEERKDERFADNKGNSKKPFDV